ncbi:MAG: lysylphosphatidylglycerol synthase transmembrane domain-containing protein [Planctomycetota bacterium]
MNLKKLLITLAKVSLSLLIIGYLFWAALKKPEDREAFSNMLLQPKRWDLLAAAFVVMLGGILITLVRWWYLVRAVGISFSFSDSMRIGFLGYLFNLAPMGIVGGDLLKAWMLSREKAGSRAQAFASVIVDRAIGLYVLFLVATGGVFVTGFWNLPDPTVHWVCRGVIAIAAIATVGIALLLLPGVLEGSFMRALTRIPKVGRAIGSLLDALLIYRSNRLALFLSAVMTIPVHTLLTFSVILIALGLRFTTVPWVDYFGIFPISGIASTIPLPAGPTESSIVFFYTTAVRHACQATDIAATVDVEAIIASAAQNGLILALVYRLSTILIAPIGAAYYFLGGRSEVTEVMHDAEEET